MAHDRGRTRLSLRRAPGLDDDLNADGPSLVAFGGRPDGDPDTSGLDKLVLGTSRDLWEPRSNVSEILAHEPIWI
jgi:hypothetical protein